jgi:hypothetical protein
VRDVPRGDVLDCKTERAGERMAEAPRCNMSTCARGCSSHAPPNVAEAEVLEAEGFSDASIRKTLAARR